VRVVVMALSQRRSNRVVLTAAGLVRSGRDDGVVWHAHLAECAHALRRCRCDTRDAVSARCTLSRCRCCASCRCQLCIVSVSVVHVSLSVPLPARFAG
jgi:hypothetical protein